MEGTGSGLEEWRGKAHLGSSLPVSARRRPCPLVISRVHASWPVSARCSPCPCIVPHVCVSFPMSACCCLCPRVVACVHALLPVSARCCLCPRVVACVRMCCPWSACCSPRLFTFMGGRFRSWAWVVAFVRGRSSSFVGNGREWWWRVLGAGVDVWWHGRCGRVVVPGGACDSWRVVIWLPHRQLQRGTFGWCQ